MSYWGGLLEGINTKREETFARNFEQDVQRRQAESKVYEYLLQSRDPQIKALAFTGLLESLQPGTKKKGLRGFMGEVEGSAILPQIQALMNEEVPQEASAPTPPAAPGSAAMPSTSMVERPTDPGAADVSSFMDVPPPPTMPETGTPPLDARSMTGIPMRPPESQFKRRGTGVPTAEEIAEENAAAQLRGRTKAILASLQSVGAPPEMQQRAMMGIAGAPMPLDTTANGPLMADPNDPQTPIPTIRHRDGTVTLTNGAPLPANYVGYRRPTTGGALTTTVEDTPEIRARIGIPAEEVNPTGFWRVRQNADGSYMWQATEYAPPPAYAGTGTFADPASPTGRTVRPINRGGGVGPDLGPAPAPTGEPTPEQANAEALLQVVNKAVAAQENASGPTPQMRKKLTPAQIDTIVRTEASRSGQPFTTYFELQRAAQGATVGGGSGGRSPASGGSVADRVRQRLLQDRAGGGAPPPARPPARTGGAGPRQ